jgi:hypothetical protein
VPAELDEEPEPDDAELEPEQPAPRRPVEPRPVRTGARTARHRIDPLGPAPAKSKRFGRRSEAVTGDAEMPDGPPRRRLLPAQARGED